jgi:hypothetical protein
VASDEPDCAFTSAELRGDLGQRGQAAVLDHGAQEVLTPGSERRLAAPATSKTWAAPTFGLSANWRSCASPATAASTHLSRSGRRRSAGHLEQRLGVGTCDGGEFCRPWSEFGLQAAQQIGMHTGVDFLAQDLLGALDGQRGDLLAQRLAGLARPAARLRPWPRR